MADIHSDRILILDFGSQYTQLIARRVREAGVYCEIHPWDMNDDAVREFAPNGVILSGGPESVTWKSRRGSATRCSNWACRCWVSATACRPWPPSWVARGALKSSRVRLRPGSPEWSLRVAEDY